MAKWVILILDSIQGDQDLIGSQGVTDGSQGDTDSNQRGQDQMVTKVKITIACWLSSQSSSLPCLKLSHLSEKEDIQEAIPLVVLNEKVRSSITSTHIQCSTYP